jgi:HSP20 family molecular chaperone IbpA
MSRAGTFGIPYCVGFGEIERLLERAAKSSTEAYPPVNVEEPSEGCLCVTLAVAGFPPELLSLTLTGRELTVKGERPQQEDTRVYLHKGIAARGFQRTFVLADGLEIEGARLLNGLLRIEMKRVAPNPQIRQIPITRG